MILNTLSISIKIPTMETTTHHDYLTALLKDFDRLKCENEKLKKKCDDLSETCDTLEKFKSSIEKEAQDEAERIICEAKDEAERIKREAEAESISLIEEAKDEADRIKLEAEAEAKRLLEKAKYQREIDRQKADEQAKIILNNAEKDGNDILLHFKNHEETRRNEHRRAERKRCEKLATLNKEISDRKREIFTLGLHKAGAEKEFEEQQEALVKKIDDLIEFQESVERRILDAYEKYVSMTRNFTQDLNSTAEEMIGEIQSIGINIPKAVAAEKVAATKIQAVFKKRRFARANPAVKDAAEKEAAAEKKVVVNDFATMNPDSPLDFLLGVKNRKTEGWSHIDEANLDEHLASFAR